MNVLYYVLVIAMLSSLLYFFSNAGPNKSESVEVDRNEIDEYTDPDIWIVIPPR